MRKNEIPSWQNNYMLFSDAYSIIQLYSCIDDLVPLDGGNAPDSYIKLEEWLWKVNSRDPNNLVVFYSALNGFNNPYDNNQMTEFNRLGGNGDGACLKDAVKKIIQAFQKSVQKRIIVIFDSTLRCLTAGPVIAPDDQRAFTALKSAIINNPSPKNHQLIFISERSSDLPAFILATQSLAKSIIVPMPDQILRFNFLKFLLAHRNLPDDKLNSIAQQAEDLTLKEIRTAITRLNVANGTPHQISEAIKLFKLGFTEDQWSLINRENIKNAEETLRSHVFGQESAVKYAAQLVKAAASGFTGVLQEDGKTAPKGTLFFCGLPGTGKTELAKSIARLVFGSADAIIRFDMGEFMMPHSAERLTGSPPGYVGHDAGGQLTEAIKAHPFSLLLFDEIEKAHPTIFNKFLAILDDGRLTDGKGETVSFENTIIIFTSNLGAAQAMSETDPDVVREIITQAVRDFCEKPPTADGTGGIGKPELYSRLAGNIVVFNPLTDEILEKIYESNVEKIKNKYAEMYSVNITLSEPFEEELHTLIRSMQESGEFPGGRGVKKALDKYLNKPLLQFLVDNDCNSDNQYNITITGMTIDSEIVHLQGTVVRTIPRNPAPNPPGGNGPSGNRPDPDPSEKKRSGFVVVKKNMNNQGNNNGN